MFNAITFKERIPKNRVKNCLSVSQDSVCRDDKQALNKYSKQFKDDGYQITYVHPDYKNFGNVKLVNYSGRIKPDPYTGLSVFSSKVRGYLAYGIYIDVDMVNCHPTILNHLMKVNGINTDDTLQLYINDRDNFLSKNKIDKNEFLISINKSDYVSKTSVHKKIHDQIYKQLLPILLEKDTDLKNVYNSSRVFNKEGKLIANYLQVEEFKLLTTLYTYCRDNNIMVDVLMHDGFFVRIDENINEEIIKNKYLDEFQKLIEKEYGFTMNFKVKPHNDELKKFFDESTTSEDYVKLKLEFEKNHAKIIDKAFYIKEYDEYITIFNQSKFYEAYKDYGYKGFIKQWLEDVKKRKYRDVGTYPNERDCPPDVFNTWRKFRCELIDEYEHKQEELEFMLNHIMILCNNEEKIYNYVIKWIAHMIQYPEFKSTAITLISGEGAGKGSLINFMKKMLGSNKVFETANPSRDVWGTFNNMMLDSFFVNINEMSKRDIVYFEGNFKSLTTDIDMVMNIKGLSQFTVQSYHRYLITTNNQEPLDTSRDDRRNLIIKSSDELIGNREYFKKFNEYVESNDVIKTCYEYFKKVEVESQLGEKPVTDYQKELQDMKVDVIILWLEDLIKDYENTFTMNNTECYDLFTNFLAKNNFQYQVNNRTFHSRLARYKFEGICTDRTSKIRSKIFFPSVLEKEIGKYL